MGAAASAIPLHSAYGCATGITSRLSKIYGTATETCRAICPYSKTKIFFGSEIRSAVAKDGQRYADLETAFVYRKQLVA